MGVIFLLVAVVGVVVDVVTSQEVDLEQGKLRGVIKNTGVGQVTEFLGVPYAEPPVGSMRFQLPRRHRGWRGTYDARAYKPACVQRKEHLKYREGFDRAMINSFRVSEDCLYANVVVKGNRVPPPGNARAVMVWIHGGRFDYGSGQLIGSTTAESPEAIVIRGDVILVTFNYRLGLFGFYTAGGDRRAPANNALWDQHLALAWVQENIARFGGDPTNVTLVGDEDGAVAVSYHIVSPRSGGLFQRAAMHSGPGPSLVLPDLDSYRVNNHQWTIEDAVGCANSSLNTTQTLECMRDKSADAILEATPSEYPRVIVDGVYLPEQPLTLWENGGFQPLDLIVGCNSGDGDHVLFGDPDGSALLRRGISVSAAARLIQLQRLGYPSTHTKEGRDLLTLVEGIYFTAPRDPSAVLYDLFRLIRDAFYCSPASKAAFLNAKAGGTTYVYYFSHVAPPVIRKYNDSSLPVMASFGSELRYVLGDPVVQASRTPAPEDMLLSRSMSHAWFTFAKTGKPRFLTANLQPVAWPAVRPSNNMPYVEFAPPMGTNSIHYGGIQRNASIIWNRLLPAAHNARVMNLPTHPVAAKSRRQAACPMDESAEGDGDTGNGNGPGSQNEAEWWSMMGRPKPKGRWKWIDDENDCDTQRKDNLSNDQDERTVEAMSHNNNRLFQVDFKAMGLSYWVLLGVVTLVFFTTLISSCVLCCVARRLGTAIKSNKQELE